MENQHDQLTETPVLIIGAGPAGLAVAGHLKQRNIPFIILEQTHRVGNSWHQHYDRLHLHTVKELSHLPFLPFPEDYPRYVPRQKLAEYLELYARHFQINPVFGEAVLKIKKEDGKWLAETTTGKKFLTPQVVVATGVNRIPNRPVFEGESLFQGVILHSRKYKNPAPFQGKKVLVVGMGNTGAEIALDLCEHNIETWISVRSPVNIVPRDFFGRPTQLTAMTLARLPVWVGDRIGILLRAITTGNLKPYGIQTPETPPARQLRDTGQTPVIDIGTVKMIKAGKIRITPGIHHFLPTEIAFDNKLQLPFDAVILATGYRPGIPDFLEDPRELLDSNELPKSVIGEGKYEGLYFLGFDNYTAGGILGVIHRDAALIASHLAKSH